MVTGAAAAELGALQAVLDARAGLDSPRPRLDVGRQVLANAAMLGGAAVGPEFLFEEWEILELAPPAD